jgi:hypothetical protein
MVRPILSGRSEKGKQTIFFGPTCYDRRRNQTRFVVVVGYISLDTSKAHNEPKNCVDIKTALNLH